MLFAVLLIAAVAQAQTLPGTQPLTITGDPALQMVDGIKRWLSQEAPQRIPHRQASVERLRYIIGAVDQRVPFNDLELVGTLGKSSDRAPRVKSVRWPVFE